MAGYRLVVVTDDQDVIGNGEPRVPERVVAAGRGSIVLTEDRRGRIFESEQLARGFIAAGRRSIALDDKLGIIGNVGGGQGVARRGVPMPVGAVGH